MLFDAINHENSRSRICADDDVSSVAPGKFDVSSEGSYLFCERCLLATLYCLH